MLELGEEVWLSEALSELLGEELGEPEGLDVSLMLWDELTVAEPLVEELSVSLEDADVLSVQLGVEV